MGTWNKEYNRYAQIQTAPADGLVYQCELFQAISVVEDIEIVVAFDTDFAWTLHAGEGGPSIMNGSTDLSAVQHYFQWTGIYVMYPNDVLWLTWSAGGSGGSMDISVSGHDEPWRAPMYPTALGG